MGEKVGPGGAPGGPGGGGRSMEGEPPMAHKPIGSLNSRTNLGLPAVVSCAACDTAASTDNHYCASVTAVLWEY